MIPYIEKNTAYRNSHKKMLKLLERVYGKDLDFNFVNKMIVAMADTEYSLRQLTK